MRASGPSSAIARAAASRRSRPAAPPPSPAERASAAPGRRGRPGWCAARGAGRRSRPRARRGRPPSPGRGGRRHRRAAPRCWRRRGRTGPDTGSKASRAGGQIGGAGEGQIAGRAAEDEIGSAAPRSGRSRARPARRAAGCRAPPGRSRPRRAARSAERQPGSVSASRYGPGALALPGSIAISGWASSCRKLGRGPRKRISSTASVIGTMSATAPSTGFSGLRLARLSAARSRATTCWAVTGLPSAHCARRMRKV